MAKFIEISRQADGEGFYLHFTGGFRAANVAKGTWQIEPVLVKEKPCATGPLTTETLQEIAKQNDFRAVVFHRFGWMNGEYYSSLAPIIPGKASHSEGPSELWSNIAGNIARPRTKEFFEKVERPSEEEIANALDDRNPVEALARYISLSLRSMDISVEQIAEHYHEQLVKHMAAGRVNGERCANTLSQTLYAHVHSFFLHLGAARDYVGTLLAHRIVLDPQKIDSMARIVKKIPLKNLPRDALLELLLSSGNIARDPKKTNHFTVSGWMEEVTSVRNELVHKRPYGSKYSERFGCVLPIQKEAGLFRYFRPLDFNGKAKQDLFEVIHYHYARFTDLMNQAAKASGYDTAMVHMTDEDIIPLN